MTNILQFDGDTVVYTDPDAPDITIICPLDMPLVQHVRKVLDLWRDAPPGTPINYERYDTAYGGCILTAPFTCGQRIELDAEHAYPGNGIAWVYDTSKKLFDSLGLQYAQLDMLQWLHDSSKNLGELRSHMAVLAAQVV